MKLPHYEISHKQNPIYPHLEKSLKTGQKQGISQSEDLQMLLQKQSQNLAAHPMYGKLNSIESIQCFMKFHIYAVWDFMSLLKSLQNKISCTSVPWKPSGYSGDMVRLINEIVLGEESDLDHAGKATSHFSLYVRAMKEMGVNTFDIYSFLEEGCITSHLKPGIREFVTYNLDIAQSGAIEEVAATFFYGREKLIPDMFTSIVDVLKREGMECPTLIYYLERHIEVDGQEHGVLAEKCLDYLCDSEPKKIRALKAGLQSLYLREQLWDYAASEMTGIEIDFRQNLKRF